MSKHRITAALVATLTISALTFIVAPEVIAAQYTFSLIRDASAFDDGDGHGDPNGSGTAELRVNVRKAKVCWNLGWEDLDAPVTVQLFKGTVVAPPGPLTVAPLVENGAGTDTAEGCRKVNGRKLRALVKNPGGHYLLVSDDNNGGGALRGHLRGGQNFSLLDGPQVPTASIATGSAFITFDAAKGKSCWVMRHTITNTITIAHVHRDAGSSILFEIPIAVLDGNPNKIGGCTTAATTAQLQEVTSNPDDFYINVHSNIFPSGEIRGELLPPEPV